jgi:carboxypeptidase C (cathepsin A)
MARLSKSPAYFCPEVPLNFARNILARKTLGRMIMSRFKFGACVGLAVALALPAYLAAAPNASNPPDKKSDSDSEKADGGKFQPFKPESVSSTGTVTIGGQAISYQAVAGTLVVHPKDWDDVPRDPKAEKGPGAGDDGDKNPTAEASMFYVAYFKTGGSPRPVTFVYNGGPGSATVWLHMGAFGPRRIVTATDAHTPAAPYSLTNNGSSLLDATDLVFIDAPGTGFSRIAGKDKEKAFFGVDQDAYAFAEFISQFLSKYGRWNSPKYLFGESYGTPRSAVLINQLQSDRAIDFNGVILLSQILNFDLSPDRPTGNPGIDLPYQTVLPTYAATAWYHKKLPGEHKDLESLLAEVEQFAMGDYARALAAGSDLSAADRRSIAEKLHQYDVGLTTGRLDTRFSGPDLDPLSQRADYDPQSTALSSAYVSAFNDYVRKDLRYGEGKSFKHSIQTFGTWNFQHSQPGQNQRPASSRQGSNVMPDLANAMKINPNLKIQLNAGYFDLATPFYQGVYEMHHLPVPAKLQSNIEYKFYDSGHMVYAKDSSLKLLHDNVAGFIRRTSTPANQ